MIEKAKKGSYKNTSAGYKFIFITVFLSPLNMIEKFIFCNG